MKAASTHIFAVMLGKVQAAKDALVHDGFLPPGTDGSRIAIEPPREAAHGDMATNAAMVLAKVAGRKPRELADALARRLSGDRLVEKVEVAGPGFINLTLKPAAWIDALRAVLREGRVYGRSAAGEGTRVNVEYVSANPTGPMHVGHCRGAVFGDALFVRRQANDPGVAGQPLDLDQTQFPAIEVEAGHVIAEVLFVDIEDLPPE